jgi:hypothetical protein
MSQQKTKTLEKKKNGNSLRMLLEGLITSRPTMQWKLKQMSE